MEWEFYCHLLCSRSRFTTTVEMNSTNDSWIDAINLHDKHYTTMLRQHKGYVIWPSGEPQLTQWFIFISFKKFSTTLKSWIWVENKNFYFWDWVRENKNTKPLDFNSKSCWEPSLMNLWACMSLSVSPKARENFRNTERKFIRANIMNYYWMNWMNICSPHSSSFIWNYAKNTREWETTK